MKRKILQSVLLPLFLLALSFQAFSETMETEKSLTELGDRLPLTYEKSIPQGKYIGGGVASILLGLGLGHAIQGRYSEKGWIFTAGGVPFYAGVIAFYLEIRYVRYFGLLESSFNRTDENIDPLNNVKLYLTWAALILGSGIKIWEMIDAWMLPSHYKVVRESPFEIKPLAFYDPNTNFNYGLSFKYKF